MRRLLLSDILMRFCERVPYAWVVIFAMDYIGVSAQQVGDSHDNRNARRHIMYHSRLALRRSISARAIRDRDLRHVHAFSDQLADVAQFFRPGHCVHDPRA